MKKKIAYFKENNSKIITKKIQKKKKPISVYIIENKNKNQGKKNLNGLEKWRRTYCFMMIHH